MLSLISKINPAVPQGPCSLHSGWPSPNGSVDDGFDDTEGFVTPNDMDSMNSEALWGRRISLCYVKTQHPLTWVFPYPVV